MPEGHEPNPVNTFVEFFTTVHYYEISRTKNPDKWRKANPRRSATFASSNGCYFFGAYTDAEAPEFKCNIIVLNFIVAELTMINATSTIFNSFGVPQVNFSTVLKMV